MILDSAVPDQPSVPSCGGCTCVKSPLHHRDALDKLSERGGRATIEEPIVSPHAFQKDCSDKHGDAYSSDFKGPLYELFRQAERGVGYHPIHSIRFIWIR